MALEDEQRLERKAPAESTPSPDTEGVLDDSSLEGLLERFGLVLTDDPDFDHSEATFERAKAAFVAGIRQTATGPVKITEADFERAAAEVARLQSDLDITNADHIVLWLEANLPDASLSFIACRIVEAHEAALRTAQNTGRDEVLGDYSPAEIEFIQCLLDRYSEGGGVIPLADDHEAFMRIVRRHYSLKSSPPVSTVDKEGGGQ